MELTEQQLQEIKEQCGLTIPEIERHAKHLGIILNMLEQDQRLALFNWFQTRNRAIADIKQQPFFRRKQ